MSIRRITAGALACLAVAVFAVSHAGSSPSPRAKWSQTPALGHATWYRAKTLDEVTRGRDVVEARVVGAVPGRPMCPPVTQAKVAPQHCVQTTYVEYVTEREFRGHAPASFRAFFVGTPGVVAVDEDPFPDKGDVNLLFLTDNCTTGVLCFGGPDGRYDVRDGVVHAHAHGGVAGRLNGKSIDEVGGMVR